MANIDWLIVGCYLVALLALSALLGRKQSSKRDYYLGGGSLSSPALAVSIIATQCSTNSLLGAPAFVGFAAAGGLIWLQYELAVPLAMLGLLLLFPAVHRSGVISIYEFLEQRLGREARLAASACFLFFRGVATGVTVYGVASVLALVTGTSYLAAVLLLMGVTIAYDVLGGMRAVVVSDVAQMLVLIAAVLVSLVWLTPELQTYWQDLGARRETLLFDRGVSGESDFGLWPMLIGGLFLYMAYYGCDQSQAQRLLAARDERSLSRVLLLNGLLRFPLVAAYCLLGLGLAAYAMGNPDFIDALPIASSGRANYNLVFPTYVLREFPPGLVGLAIVGLFAAAMSSIDSALNSLSASSLEDFGKRANGEQMAIDEFRQSKLLTLAWGGFAVVFSFFVEQIASTILEAINKVGSMANGPLLAMFALAVVYPRVGGRAAVAGLFLGIVANALAWKFLPTLSWLWWNPLGFVAAITGALAYSAAGVFENKKAPANQSLLGEAPTNLGGFRMARGTAYSLTAGFLCMLALMVWLQSQ
ncbi:MAG: sodium:solute symporter [Congregibacter sp.]